MKRLLYFIKRQDPLAPTPRPTRGERSVLLLVTGI